MPVLDPKMIADIRELESTGSPGLLAELIDLFLKELVQHLLQLRKALADRDASLLERVAHTLKGSSGNLGARDLSGVCGQLQGIARSGDWGSAEALVVRIEKDSAIVKAALLEERGRP